MPREINTHKSNVCNEAIKIEAIDEPGSGGACHLYHVTGFNSSTNPSDPWTARHGEPAQHSTILFQNGPIGETGVNGITHEVLLAILIDRLEGFQSGPYNCHENEVALSHLRGALAALNQRTAKRVEAGIEGTHQIDATKA